MDFLKNKGTKMQGNEPWTLLSTQNDSATTTTTTTKSKLQRARLDTVQQPPCFSMFISTPRNILMAAEDSCLKHSNNDPNVVHEEKLEDKTNCNMQLRKNKQTKVPEKKNNVKRKGKLVTSEEFYEIVKKMKEDEVQLIQSGKMAVPKLEKLTSSSYFHILSFGYDAHTLEQMRKLPEPLEIELEEQCPSMAAFNRIADKAKKGEIEFCFKNSQRNEDEACPANTDDNYPNTLREKYKDMILDKMKQNNEFPRFLSKEPLFYSQMIFCRRCFIFCCPTHADFPVSYDLIPKTYYGKNSNGCGVNCGLTNPIIDLSPSLTATFINREDEKMINVLLGTFPNNFCTVASLANKTCNQVHKYAEVHGIKLQKKDLQIDTFAKPQKRSKDSKASCPYKKNAKLFSNYRPCLHPGTPCTRTNDCYCRVNYLYCEKYCCCDENCSNRFPGCNCTGKCKSRTCPCVAAHRECDPDLCVSCGSHQIDFKKMKCENIVLQKGKHKHLLVAESTIPKAGNGVFAKDAIRKGEFVYEYCGEILTMEEAEVRAETYDRKQQTYLFDLDTESVLDGARIGNKIRFANHSNKPNCQAVYLMVNGDTRVAIYATRDIKPHEELFIYYADVLKKHAKWNKDRLKREGNNGENKFNYSSNAAEFQLKLDLSSSSSNTDSAEDTGLAEDSGSAEEISNGYVSTEDESALEDQDASAEDNDASTEDGSDEEASNEDEEGSHEEASNEDEDGSDEEASNEDEEGSAEETSNEDEEGSAEEDIIVIS